MVMAVGSIVQVGYFCDGVTQYSANVVHYRCTAITGVPLNALQMAIALGGIAGPVFKALLPVTAAYYGTRVQIIRPVIEPAAVSKAGAGAGSIAGDPLPEQTCGLISLRTPVASKSARGRLYVPFPPEANSDADASPDAAYLALATNLASALLLPALTIVVGAQNATLKPVIWSRKLLASFDTTDFVVRETWATQRRRSQMRGGDVAPF